MEFAANAGARGIGTSVARRDSRGDIMKKTVRLPSAWRWVAGAGLVVATMVAPFALAWAEEAPKIDTGDNAWMLTSAALVLSMTAPGLALFYGGLVRSKNVLNMLMQSFIMVALISIQWVLWGYSLAFGPDHGPVMGGLEWLGLRGVGFRP